MILRETLWFYEKWYDFTRIIFGQKYPDVFFLKKKKRKLTLFKTCSSLFRKYTLHSLFLCILSLKTKSNPYRKSHKAPEMAAEMAPEIAQGQEEVRVFCFFFFCFISIRWVLCFLLRLLSILLMYLRLWVIEYEN